MSTIDVDFILKDEGDSIFSNKLNFHPLFKKDDIVFINDKEFLIIEVRNQISFISFKITYTIVEL